jgi:maltose O-acetyltransferase
VIFDYTFPHLISVGENTTIAGNVIILAHDASMKRLIGYTKLGRVSIGNNCFIGERTLILPNVAIGDNSVVGAGSVVVRDIPENSVACGNPARVLKSTSVFVEKHKQEMKIIDRKDGVSYVL